MEKTIEEINSELLEIIAECFDENADQGISLKKVMSRDKFIEVVSILVLKTTS